MDLKEELERRNGDRVVGDEACSVVLSAAAPVDDSEGDLLNLARMEEGIER